jgi:hypothetical protein
MTTLKLAHVKEQGVDLIVVPLADEFGRRTQSDQNSAITELQMRSRSAGLAGTVVPVWDSGGGRMAFIAPPNWHSFFRSIGLDWVWRNVNRELSW